MDQENSDTYVAQTFEPEDTVTSQDCFDWWARQKAAATKLGLPYVRCTSMNVLHFGDTHVWSGVGGAGLLFEAWRKKPDHMPEPQWDLRPQSFSLV